MKEIKGSKMNKTKKGMYWLTKSYKSNIMLVKMKNGLLYKFEGGKRKVFILW